MKKLITIFAVVLMTIIPFVFAQSIFTTTTDNSNEAGTFGSPDGDMDTSICYDHPSQPVEFYINQNINISAIENASLRLAVRNTNTLGSPPLGNVTINGNSLGTFTTPAGNPGPFTEVSFNVNPSFLFNGNNLVNITLFTFHCANVDNGSLIINQTTIPPDSCFDTDGNNINVQGTVSGFSNGTQFSNNDTCYSGNSVNEFTCNLVIPVSTNISCGTNGFVGNSFCLTGSVYRNFTTNFCSSGACGSTITPQLVTTCYFGCNNGACTSPPPGDNDSDGMSNGYEFNHTCLNPLVNDANVDWDNDSAVVRYPQNLTVYQNISLTNIQEMQLGLRPCQNDTDADYGKDGVEIYIGTNATAKCSLTSTADDEPVDAWPFDINDDKKATLADVLKYIPSFNTVAGNATFNKRFDINADGKISLADVLNFNKALNKNCTQI